jgi:hypothetical protein
MGEAKLKRARLAELLGETRRAVAEYLERSGVHHQDQSGERG